MVRSFWSLNYFLNIITKLQSLVLQCAHYYEDDYDYYYYRNGEPQMWSFVGWKWQKYFILYSLSMSNDGEGGIDAAEDKKDLIDLTPGGRMEGDV